MIKEKDIETVRSSRVKDKENALNFETIKTVIEEEIEDYGYTVKFFEDELKIGGMFNSSVEKVLVLANAEHESDYFKYVFRLGKQGIFTILDVYITGTSKLIDKELRTAQKLEGGGVITGIASAISNRIHNKDSELIAERNYYNVFEDEILSAILS